MYLLHIKPTFILTLTAPLKTFKSALPLTTSSLNVFLSFIHTHRVNTGAPEVSPRPVGAESGCVCRGKQVKAAARAQQSGEAGSPSTLGAEERGGVQRGPALRKLNQ